MATNWSTATHHVARQSDTKFVLTLAVVGTHSLSAPPHNMLWSGRWITLAFTYDRTLNFIHGRLAGEKTISKTDSRTGTSRQLDQVIFSVVPLTKCKLYDRVLEAPSIAQSHRQPELTNRAIQPIKAWTFRNDIGLHDSGNSSLEIRLKSSAITLQWTLSDETQRNTDTCQTALVFDS